MKHLVLCVNYRKDEEAADFASHVVSQPGFNGRVLVTSCSTPESPRLLSPAEPNVLTIDAGANLGYFGGAAYGLQAHLRDSALPDWVLVSNTDVSFVDSRFFAGLDELELEGAPAVVAPDIRLESPGLRPSTPTNQNPAMEARPSRHRLQLLLWASRWPIGYWAYENLTAFRWGVVNRISRAAERPNNGPRDVYAAFGACIVLHRSYFENGGTLRFGSFLFGEEIFVAETARGLGLRTRYEPRLRLLHREHGTTGNVGAFRRQRYVHQSLKYLLDEVFD